MKLVLPVEGCVQITLWDNGLTLSINVTGWYIVPFINLLLVLFFGKIKQDMI